MPELVFDGVTIHYDGPAMDDEETADWIERERVARAAQQTAREELHAAGAALIFLRGGKLFAERADGSVEELPWPRKEVHRPNA